MTWTIASGTVGLGIPGASSPALADFTGFNTLIAPRSIDLMLFLQDLDTEPIYYSSYKTWATSLGVTMISTMSPGTHKIADFASGAFDSSGLNSGGLQGLANDAKNAGGPIIFRLAHEFNGDWNGYGWGKETAAAFVAGWRHIHDVFTAAGATNVLWFWCPNIWDPPGGPPPNSIDPTANDGSGSSWYPGDAYVDIIGLDGYMMTANPVTSAPADLFLANYTKLVANYPSKPFAIGEFGVAAQSRLSTLGGKAGWYDKFFNMVQQKMPKCSFVCQWQRSAGPDDTTISSSGTDAAAALRFVAGVETPRFVPGGVLTDIPFVGNDELAYPQRYKDMGDGTFARVISDAVDPGGASKALAGDDYLGLTRKLKDMGDSTFALVRIGG